MKTRLSISIVTHHTDMLLMGELLVSLKKALVRLEEQRGAESIVYLVDNSVDQAHFLELKDLFTDTLQGIEKSNLVVIAAEENGGYGAGHNRAISQADSHYHLILNPDLVLAEDSLVEAVEYLDSRTETGLLTPFVKKSVGETQYVAKRYPDLVTLMLRALNRKEFNKRFEKRLSRYEMRELIDAGKATDVALAGGCFMFARTELLKKIGGFSSSYFMYFEDFDLSIRIGKMAAIDFVPSVKITHWGGDASNKGLKHFFYFSRSAIRFFQTHGWKFY